MDNFLKTVNGYKVYVSKQWVKNKIKIISLFLVLLTTFGLLALRKRTYNKTLMSNSYNLIEIIDCIEKKEKNKALALLDKKITTHQNLAWEVALSIINNKNTPLLISETKKFRSKRTCSTGQDILRDMVGFSLLFDSMSDFPKMINIIAKYNLEDSFFRQRAELLIHIYYLYQIQKNKNNNSVEEARLWLKKNTNRFYYVKPDSIIFNKYTIDLYSVLTFNINEFLKKGDRK
jgi:hypothetical protein